MKDDIAGTMTTSSPDGGKTFKSKFCYGPGLYENFTFDKGTPLQNWSELFDYVKVAMNYVNGIKAGQEIERDLNDGVPIFQTDK